MAQAAYVITPADSQHAYAYLEGKLFTLTYKDEISPMAAAKQFRAIAGGKAQRAVELNAWCDMLTEKEWHRLRLAIRKRRQRATSESQVSLSVSPKAHALLSRIAKRDNVTLSEALEKIAAQAIRQSR